MFFKILNKISKIVSHDKEALNYLEKFKIYYSWRNDEKLAKVFSDFLKMYETFDERKKCNCPFCTKVQKNFSLAKVVKNLGKKMFDCELINYLTTHFRGNCSDLFAKYDLLYL